MDLLDSDGEGGSDAPPRDERPKRVGKRLSSSGVASPFRRLGPTLVVCPMSLLSQWHEQLQLHSGGALSVIVYYGQGRDKSATSLRWHDVVLTTYGTLASEGSAHLAAEAQNLAVAAQQPKYDRLGLLRY